MVSYKTIPMDWTSILDHVANNRLEVFVRSVEGEEIYQASLEKLKNEYKSVTNYLLNVKLKPLFDEILQHGDKVKAEPKSNEFDVIYQLGAPKEVIIDTEMRPRVLLVENDFPYNVEKGIDHHLIWSLEPWYDPRQVLNFLDKKLPGREFTFFLNPMNLRSIKEIFHIHVFSKRKNFN